MNLWLHVLATLIGILVLAQVGDAQTCTTRQTCYKKTSAGIECKRSWWRRRCTFKYVATRSTCTKCCTGYGPESPCTDKNECASRSENRCSHTCINTAGSYRCACRSGYRLSSNGYSCYDINECLSGSHGCSHYCRNTIGSYYCYCMPGYALDSNRKTCSDINECSSSRLNRCSHTCINTIGSYRCGCRSGYTLSTDGRSCIDINECTATSHGCSQVCINTPGSFYCSCRTGYQLDSNKKTCSDKDECALKTHQCNHTCTNTEGSYKCSCYGTTFTSMDGGKICHGPYTTRKCSDVRKQTYYAGCGFWGLKRCTQYRWQVVYKTCKTCLTGYSGAYCETAKCFGSTSCQNGGTCIGPDDCACPPGYAKPRCESACANHDCDHKCTPSGNSYVCLCNSGYILGSDGKTCTAGNPCLTNNPCNHICRYDSPGRYTCLCRSGYTLQYDRRTCTDDNECLKNPCDHTCTNTAGSYTCTCRPGYTPSYGGARCLATNLGDLKSFFLFTDTYHKRIYKMDFYNKSLAYYGFVGISNPIAIDHDPKTGLIFWTDVGAKRVYSGGVDASNQRVVRRLPFYSIPDGLTLDTTRRLVFYTDTGLDVIARMNYSGQDFRNIITTGLTEPRAIVLDTDIQRMYWTDWGANPKIEYSKYDGTNRKTLVSTGLIWPNGLVLVKKESRLYWTDAGRKKIEYINLDGTGRTVVYTTSYGHYFDIVSLGNWLYYSDWRRDQMRAVQIDGRNPIGFGPSGFGRINGLYLYDDGTHDGTPPVNTDPKACQEGEMCADFDVEGSIQSSLEGVTVISSMSGKTSANCSRQAVFRVQFNKLERDANAPPCQNGGYNHRQMLKVDLFLAKGRSSRSGYQFNIGDSKSNNGNGGDSGHSDFAAEIQKRGDTVTVFESAYRDQISDECRAQSLWKSPEIGSDVNHLTFYIANNYFGMVTDAGDEDWVCDECLYGLDGRADYRARSDADTYIYIGINRVVGGSYRSGYGTCSMKLSWVEESGIDNEDTSESSSSSSSGYSSSSSSSGDYSGSSSPSSGYSGSSSSSGDYSGSSSSSGDFSGSSSPSSGYSGSSSSSGDYSGFSSSSGDYSGSFSSSGDYSASSSSSGDYSASSSSSGDYSGSSSSSGDYSGSSSSTSASSSSPSSSSSSGSSSSSCTGSSSTSSSGSGSTSQSGSGSTSQSGSSSSSQTDSSTGQSGDSSNSLSSTDSSSSPSGPGGWGSDSSSTSTSESTSSSTSSSDSGSSSEPEDDNSDSTSTSDGSSDTTSSSTSSSSSPSGPGGWGSDSSGSSTSTSDSTSSSTSTSDSTSSSTSTSDSTSSSTSTSDSTSSSTSHSDSTSSSSSTSDSGSNSESDDDTSDSTSTSNSNSDGSSGSDGDSGSGSDDSEDDDDDVDTGSGSGSGSYFGCNGLTTCNETLLGSKLAVPNSDCENYCQCMQTMDSGIKKYVWKEYFCGAGHIWDAETRFCDLEDNSDYECPNGSYSGPDELRPKCIGTCSGPSDVNKLTTRNNTECVQHCLCVETEDNTYRWQPLYCQHGSLWASKQQRCIAEYQMICLANGTDIYDPEADSEDPVVDGDEDAASRCPVETCGATQTEDLILLPYSNCSQFCQCAPAETLANGTVLYKWVVRRCAYKAYWNHRTRQCGSFEPEACKTPYSADDDTINVDIEIQKYQGPGSFNCSGVCDDKFHGKFTSELNSNCTKYCRCVRKANSETYTWVPMFCAAGTLYESSKSLCMNEEEVQCQENGYGVYIGGDEEDDSGENNEVCPNGGCSSLTSGNVFVVKETNCTEYCKCSPYTTDDQHNPIYKWVTLTCPQGQALNATSGKCEMYKSNICPEESSGSSNGQCEGTCYQSQWGNLNISMDPDCRSFCQCSPLNNDPKFYWQMIHCGTNTRFSQNYSTCVHENNANCSGKNTPSVEGTCPVHLCKFKQNQNLMLLPGSDCRKFCQCSPLKLHLNGTAEYTWVVKECALGTRWNNQTGNCGHFDEDTYECPDSGSSSSGSGSGINKGCPAICSHNERESFRAANDTSCASYCQCAPAHNGGYTWLKMYCAPGTYYDESEKQCLMIKDKNKCTSNP